MTTGSELRAAAAAGQQQRLKRIKVQSIKRTFFYIRLKFWNSCAKCEICKKNEIERKRIRRGNCATNSNRTQSGSTCPRRSRSRSHSCSSFPSTPSPSPQFALTPPNENSAVSGTRKWRKARSSKVKVRRSTLEILALALAPAQPNSAQSSYDSSLPKLPQKTCQLAKTREK